MLRFGDYSKIFFLAGLTLSMGFCQLDAVTFKFATKKDVKWEDIEQEVDGFLDEGGLIKRSKESMQYFIKKVRAAFLTDYAEKLEAGKPEKTLIEISYNHIQGIRFHLNYAELVVGLALINIYGVHPKKLKKGERGKGLLDSIDDLSELQETLRAGKTEFDKLQSPGLSLANLRRDLGSTPETGDEKTKKSLSIRLMSLFTIKPNLLLDATEQLAQNWMKKLKADPGPSGDLVPEPKTEIESAWTNGLLSAYGFSMTYQQFTGDFGNRWFLNLFENLLLSLFWHHNTDTDVRTALLVWQERFVDRREELWRFANSYQGTEGDTVFEFVKRGLNLIGQKRAKLTENRAARVSEDSEGLGDLASQFGTDPLGFDVDLNTIITQLLRIRRKAKDDYQKALSGWDTTKSSTASSIPGAPPGAPGSQPIDASKTLFVSSVRQSEITGAQLAKNSLQAYVAKIQQLAAQMRPAAEGVPPETVEIVSLAVSTPTSSTASSHRSHSPSGTFSLSHESAGVKGHFDDIDADIERAVQVIQTGGLLETADKIFEVGIIIRSLVFWATKFRELANMLDMMAAQIKKDHGDWWEWFYDPERVLPEGRRNEYKNRFYRYKDMAVRLRARAQQYLSMVSQQQRKQTAMFEGQHPTDVMTSASLKLDPRFEFWSALVAQTDEELKEWAESFDLTDDSAELEKVFSKRLLDPELMDWMGRIFRGKLSENLGLAKELVLRVRRGRQEFYEMLDEIEAEQWGYSSMFQDLTDPGTDQFEFEKGTDGRFHFSPQFGGQRASFEGIEDMAQRGADDFKRKARRVRVYSQENPLIDGAIGTVYGAGLGTAAGAGIGTGAALGTGLAVGAASAAIAAPAMGALALGAGAAGTAAYVGSAETERRRLLKQERQRRGIAEALKTRADRQRERSETQSRMPDKRPAPEWPPAPFSPPPSPTGSLHALDPQLDPTTRRIATATRELFSQPLGSTLRQGPPLVAGIPSASPPPPPSPTGSLPPLAPSPTGILPPPSFPPPAPDLSRSPSVDGLSASGRLAAAKRDLAVLRAQSSARPPHSAFAPPPPPSGHHRPDTPLRPTPMHPTTGTFGSPGGPSAFQPAVGQQPPTIKVFPPGAGPQQHLAPLPTHLTGGLGRDSRPGGSTPSSGIFTHDRAPSS